MEPAKDRARARRSIWRYDRRDAFLFLIACGHLLQIALIAIHWPSFSLLWRFLAIAALTAGTWYCIAIVGHLFLHAPWFVSRRGNACVGCQLSLTMAQSVAEYRISHAFNHHRFNNDRQNACGETSDTSSTFRHGVAGGHQALVSYALCGATRSMMKLANDLVSLPRAWRGDAALRDGVGHGPDAKAVRQETYRAVRRERTCLALFWLAMLSVPTFIPYYLVALWLGFALVNVQNYFEHFGALPEDPCANSVSHYGRLYNWLTFCDGYHQEHHLRPACHWSKLKALRVELAADFSGNTRIVSPFPAVLGFLDRNRVRLDLTGGRWR